MREPQRRPRGRWLAAAALGWCAVAAAQENAAPGAPAPLPPARDILDQARLNLPREPLQLIGELRADARAAAGAARTLQVAFRLDFSRTPGVACYAVRDAFGEDLDRLTVTHHPDRPPQYVFQTGTSLAVAPMPDLFSPIRGTDVSWGDLTLSFLWWPQCTTLRVEEVLRRPCYVVEVMAPPGSTQHYSGLLLWIEQQFGLLLKAEGYDRRGLLSRQLAVKSFKKINDRWMVKDLDVRSYPEGHRTRLRVLGVETPDAAGRPTPDPEPAAPGDGR